MLCAGVEVGELWSLSTFLRLGNEPDVSIGFDQRQTKGWETNKIFREVDHCSRLIINGQKRKYGGAVA